MCLDDIKGEVPKGEVFWTWAGGLTCFFLSHLVSARSQVSTTESRLAEFFNSSTSDNLSALLNSPSWMYARCVAHVSRPSKIWVAYTIVVPLYRKYDNIIKDNIFVWIGCLNMSTSKACHIFYMWLANRWRSSSSHDLLVCPDLYAYLLSPSVSSVSMFQNLVCAWMYGIFFLINNSEIFIRTELQIVHKACTMKQE